MSIGCSVEVGIYTDNLTNIPTGRNKLKGDGRTEDFFNIKVKRNERRERRRRGRDKRY